MKKFLFFIVLCTSIFVSAANELQIIATGDIHGKMDRFSRLATVIRSYPEAVKIDLGDLFHGDPVCDLLNGEPMISALNSLKYDFYIPGNHAFELSAAQLHRTLANFKGKILGQWQLPGMKICRWQLIERNGFRCAVIGMTDNGIWRNCRFYPGLEIIQEMEAINRSLAEIRPLAPDVVVLARHGGNYFSGITVGKFFREHPEIDLMICSHSHKEIGGQRSGRVLVVQPGPYGSSAVLITVSRTASRNLHIRSRLLRGAGKGDQELVELFERSRKKTASQLKCQLFDFYSLREFADAALKKLCNRMKSDCAVIDLPPQFTGRCSTEEYLEFFPYRNRMTTVSLDRQEYQRLLKEKVPGKRRRFASVPPAEKRYFTVTLNSFMLQRSPTLRNKKEYKLYNVIERDIIAGKITDFQRI